jgi:hypothetical protein
MTLATVFLICIFSAASAPAEMSASKVQFKAPFEGQQEPPSKPTDSSAVPSQAKPSGSQSQSPSASPPPTSAAPQSSSDRNQPVPAKPRWRKGKKKAPVAADCNSPAPAPNTAGTATSTAAAGPSTSSRSGTGTRPPAKSPGNCPPAKIVVIHDGGTTEPAIQLTGGASGGEQQSKERSTDQLLASTEDNLKKIGGRQLTSAQQETVTQIHQFMEQSKAAVAVKDMDRGHTLALKANLLSEELTKP